VTVSAELVARLRAAAAAVEAAATPDDLRGAAFVVAFLDKQKSSRGGLEADEEEPPESALPSVSRAMRKLEIDEMLIERVYDFSVEGGSLVIPRRALPESKRRAMRYVIQLVAAGRQASGFEQWTSARVVRDACEERGVLDSGNFGHVLNDLDGEGITIRGRGSKRELKMNAAGFEATGLLISQLLSTSPA
jgi:hypothetical protein